MERFVKDCEKDGFILFTLGSIPSSKFMPKKHVQTFVKVFSRIPQRVIWKWDDSSKIPENLSANVLLVDWLPQQDLLG
jgi:glucuronosyltransferase